MAARYGGHRGRSPLYQKRVGGGYLIPVSSPLPSVAGQPFYRLAHGDGGHGQGGHGDPLGAVHQDHPEDLPQGGHQQHRQLQSHADEEGPHHGGVGEQAHLKDGALLTADVEGVEQLAHGQGGEGHGEVFIKPASHGTGVVAGGAMRAVLESVGVTDVLAKSKGSSNPHNLVKATIMALGEMRDARMIAQNRGISVEKVFRG